MSANPFDKNTHPSPYSSRVVGGDSYPPQNYNSALNPWSANQANFNPVNAYDNVHSFPNPYNQEISNHYAQSSAFTYQTPEPLQEVYTSRKNPYGGANAFDYKEPGYKQNTAFTPVNTVSAPSSALSSKPSILGRVPSINSSGPSQPAPLTPLHANRTPNKWRVLLRFIGLIGSIGAFGFSVGAGPYSGNSTPFSDKSAIIFLYIWSAVSIVAFIYFLLNMLNRRVRNGAKIPRKWLLVADIVLAICWGFDVVFLIAKNHCPVGKLNGWCDFFNTSIFFAVLTFAVTVTSIFWDVYGWYIERKNRLA